MSHSNWGLQHVMEKDGHYDSEDDDYNTLSTHMEHRIGQRRCNTLSWCSMKVTHLFPGNPVTPHEFFETVVDQGSLVAPSNDLVSNQLTSEKGSTSERLLTREGQNIFMELPLYLNKTNVMTQILIQKTKALLFEVSTPHLQNHPIQKGIKRVKYANKTINRDTNVVDQLAHLYRCKVQVGLLIIACHGEVLNTAEHCKVLTTHADVGTGRVHNADT